MLNDESFDRLRKEVSRILWEEWDPLSMKMWGDSPADEYDAYVLPLISLMAKGGDSNDVASYLCRVETDQMDHTYVGINCTDVAKSCLAAYGKHCPQ